MATVRLRQTRTGGNGATGSPFSNVQDIFSAFSDIFSQSAGGGSPWSEFFGGGSGPRRRASIGQPGENLRITLRLTLAEVAQGIAGKKVKLRRFIVCEACEGTGAKGGRKALRMCGTCDGYGEQRQARQTMLGQIVNVRPCRACHGEGQVIEDKCGECWGEGRVDAEKTVSVRVPAGVSEGQYLSLRGEGNAGKRGGPPGDLRVVIKEIPSDDFERRGTDLFHDLYISFPDAALGVAVAVPTLDGTAPLNIKPGTQSGHLLRIAGKGIQDINSGRRGDLLVTVHVWTPRTLTKEDRHTLARLRKSPSFRPSARSKIRSFFNRVTDVFT